MDKNGKPHWTAIVAFLIASGGFFWNVQDRAAAQAEDKAVTRAEMDFWVNDYREFKQEQKEETKAIKESMRIQTLDMKDLKAEVKETKAMSQNTLDLMRQWDKGWKK